MTLRNALIRAVILPLCLANPGQSASAAEDSADPVYSPYARKSLPNRVLWGDTHVHTRVSADAYGMGDSLSPEDAYRFAKGEKVISTTGQPARLSRPLDFLVVSDHAEYLGVAALLDNQADKLEHSEVGQRWLKLAREHNKLQILLDNRDASMGTFRLAHDERVTRSVWEQVTEAADRHNEPGYFTAFIGYEWSSLPGGNNLHRNVLFRDGADVVKGTTPFSAIDSRNPEDLWRFLEQFEAQTGGRALAIPHNPNMSNGLMFSDRSSDGQPLTKNYSETRARWEPVIEVTQIKGDSETHPLLSPDDEFADFETWDEGNFAMPRDPKEPWMLQHEYARSALRHGLASSDALGANAFKFGVIGSSDSHTALSAVEENNYFGKFGVDEPSARRAHSEPMAASRYSASGYAAVWSTDNTREAIFDAIQRKEVYATTGPRITVRFFGGWEFSESDRYRPDYAATGYSKGVPMGGDLAAAPEGKSPSFLVLASKDPAGANLDRIQMVKGWLGSDGETHERVFDIALSDERAVDPESGKAAALVSTVDIKAASYANSIGEVQLATVWLDPLFNPDDHAFYYLRVLEIPTPRWTTYDSAFFGSKLPSKVPAEIQERAYTSPIWYTPGRLE